MKRKAKGNKVPMEVPMEAKESYPYGLRVSLEKEELTKLGVKLSDFTIGDTVSLFSNATVISMRSSESEGYDSSNLEFELRKISLGDAINKAKE